ncbi:hypothetical protein T07_14068 [Trichinella nelsoni]|uniref:Uncharacterized protein n=1 Tax=Trichinella nelsoni TaxID=6336 RepID=A0A0V0SC69_9BILA|nr:hypothetical protein T07_14068 [Trichinella nelsoni]
MYIIEAREIVDIPFIILFALYTFKLHERLLTRSNIFSSGTFTKSTNSAEFFLSSTHFKSSLKQAIMASEWLSPSFYLTDIST